jgi:hypothetical protein
MLEKALSKEETQLLAEYQSEQEQCGQDNQGVL